MSRKLQATLATLILIGAPTFAIAQPTGGLRIAAPGEPVASKQDAKPATLSSATARATGDIAKAAAASKSVVELLCEGTLRVFYLLPDGNERDTGAEHRHDLSLRVMDKKAFRSIDDAESAIQIRFEDPQACLGRSNGAACMRQVENADGRRMSTKDYFDIDRFTGRITYNYLRSYHEPVQHNGETISAVRIEYNGQCGRADAPRVDSKPATPAPAPTPAKPITPVTKPASTDSKPGSFWVIKEPAPEVKR